MRQEETKPAKQAEPDHKEFCELRGLSFTLTWGSCGRMVRREETKLDFSVWKAHSGIMGVWVGGQEEKLEGLSRGLVKK